MHIFLTLLSMLPGVDRELRLLPYLVRAGHTCVDIGASWGLYTLPLAALAGLGGRVVALEPRTGAARSLERFADLLRLGNVVVEAKAVGSVQSLGRLVVPRRKGSVPGRSYLAEGVVHERLDDGLRPGEVRGVPVTTLDDVRRRVRRPVDFVKCDVEGAEYEVLSGGRDVFEGDRPVLLCEVEDRHARRYGRSLEAVFDRLGSTGYVHLDVPMRTHLPHGPHNHLFVPEERAPGIRQELAEAGFLEPV